MKPSTRILAAFLLPSMLVVCLTVLALAVSAQSHAGDLPGEKGTHDSEQIKSLFSEIRDSIPLLKSGMKLEELRRILKTDKLQQLIESSRLGYSKCRFTFPDHPKQSLLILSSYRNDEFIVESVRLIDGDRNVAQFNADKK